MKNYKKYLFLVLSIFSLNAYSQAIDPLTLSKLTPEEVEMAKDVIASKDSSEKSLKDLPKTDETLILKKSEENAIETSIKKYGYDFFSSMPTSITAVGDLPLPNDYKISLKDQFQIILSGAKDATYTLNVMLNGTILVPELGSVSVVGLTFEEVKDKLSRLVNKTYFGVFIDVSLKNLSAKKITIVGAVDAPGTYIVNPFSTITGALAYSGGISEIGSLRDIKLIRNNKEIVSFDLYDLLIRGDRSQDLTIEAGDTILINPASQFVELDGEINRPAIYEIKEGENLEDLVRYGAGFTNIANKTNIGLEILDIESSSIKLVNSSDLEVVLTNVLRVEVNPYNNKNISSIKVYGAVKEPGHYRLSDNETFEGFIKNRLEFVDVYPWLAVLEQFDNKNLKRQSILLNLNDPKTFESIEMIANSKLYFFNIFEMESFKKYQFEDDNKKNHASLLSLNTKRMINDYTLEINHKSEIYSLPIIGEFKLQNLINFLGLDMTNVDENVSYISPFEDKIIEDNYKNIKLNAKKSHTVSFRVGRSDLINVSISGAIDYPGNYTLKSDASLDQLYSYIGNFKAQAFLDGIILTRESIRDRQIEALERSKRQLDIFMLNKAQDDITKNNINSVEALSETIDSKNLGRLSGNFSPNSESVNKIILRDGDNIIVPVVPYTITVLGEVNNQLTFGYSNNISVNDAIKMAGGFSEFANKRKVYVIKANGITVKSTSFIVGNPQLEVGDTVVVPRKYANENSLLNALQPVTQVISDLAFSAAALESLSNSNSNSN